MYDRPADGGHSPVIVVDRQTARVALVRLNRPDSLNAINRSLVDELASALNELSAEKDVSVVILTGSGKGFCSGADLRNVAELRSLGSNAVPDVEQAGAFPALEFMRLVSEPMLALTRLPQLTIAAVNGPAIGAGWGLAMGCDIRIAGTAARFGATSIRMGLGPDYGLSKTVPQAIGRARALELLLTGRVVEAAEACTLGLVSSLVADPVNAAIELGKQVAKAPNRTIGLIKSVVRESAQADLETVIGDLEPQMFADLVDHPDFLDDMASWLRPYSAKE